MPCGVDLADFAISYPCLSGVRVERDGRVQGQQGLRVREPQDVHSLDANAGSQRSSEWKLTPEPAPPARCVPLETNQATLCTGSADLCLVIYPLTTEK